MFNIVGELVAPAVRAGLNNVTVTDRAGRRQKSGTAPSYEIAVLAENRSLMARRAGVSVPMPRPRSRPTWNGWGGTCSVTR